ncbi:class I SAM-dependent methyltransferase [Sphingomonas sp. NIBR02145]|uniref:class I SAM-dependent methyltransferase n=1 Tax=Sphingomonas sp. NIBR02145 TaxID=3014784 RepID=UPI0022B5928B|nr:class I SAM-dependent methyltransferase [Sphingomonas sp. NIBR02145]WHU04274.1 class I SAM-dependent methyltransferase [Sphingomonas sp. NIBR02145]
MLIQMLSTEILHPAVQASSEARGREGERLRSTQLYYAASALDYAELTARIDTSERIDAFVALLPHAARVLDAGCGAGRDLAQFRSRGLTAVGLDLSPELAELARQRSGCEVIVGDLAAPPALGSFDGIWAMASLLHIDRSRIGAALEGLRAMLNPGGVLFSSVKRGRGDVCDETGRWFTLYDEEAWAEQMTQAGFDILEINGEPPVSGASTGTVAPGWISCMARLS